MKNADSYFCIGSTHEVCQDYASSSPDKLRAIISDGCSSAPDTDFGSRLLVKAKEKMFFDDFEQGESLAIFAAHGAACHIGLNDVALTATLLTVSLEVALPYFRTEVQGDGVIVGRTFDGDLDILSYDYNKGAPDYPRYLLKPEYRRNWIAQFPNNTFTGTETSITKDGEIVHKAVHTLESKRMIGNWEMSRYQYVAVLSDGVKSFMRREETATSAANYPVDYHEIIRELFAFKNFNGEFVKRRCKRAMKDFAAKKWFHTDDFSMGVVVVVNP